MSLQNIHPTAPLPPHTYDLVVIGGGIAGLYTAHRFRQRYPTGRLLVLEADKHLGGRTRTVRFAGTEVVLGAGIGRAHKDRRLMRLVQEMDIPTHEFPIHHEFAQTVAHPRNLREDVATIQAALRTALQTATTPQSFKQLGRIALGQQAYRDFVETTGYSDFEDADAKITLANYGMDDNTPGWIGVGIPWRLLTTKLVEIIGRQQIRTGAMATNIRKLPDAEGGFVVKVVPMSGDSYDLRTRRIVIATPIAVIRRLLPKIKVYRQHIRAQPFLRVYAQFSPHSRILMRQQVPTLTVVPAPLQEIIPMDVDRGVYMIAYADNASARQLETKQPTFADNTPGARNFYERLVEDSLGMRHGTLRITKLMSHFWKEGTHYFRPLPAQVDFEALLHQLQHPAPYIWVAGEAVASHQGWVEGTIESVDRILQEITL